jgi:hypothetical protein
MSPNNGGKIKMSDMTTKTIMSLIATESSKIRNLPIRNGQLIFVKDLGRIAMDFNNTRVFYNQIVELETEVDRLTLEDPLSGYYFIISSGCLWFYKDKWTQITEKPEEVIFIGVDLPQLGQEKKIYVTTKEGQERISIWDDSLGTYIIVSDKTQEVSDNDIEGLFD